MIQLELPGCGPDRRNLVGACSPRSVARRSSMAVLATCIAAALFGMTGPASAERVDAPIRIVGYPLDSGTHYGNGMDSAVPFVAEIHVPDVSWLCIRFAEYSLGDGSMVILHGANGTQRLTAQRMEEWSGSSAVFRGGVVALELHVAAEDRGVFVRIESVMVGGPPGPEPSSLCGDDNRVASNDNRVGRLFFGGCTAWRATNGAFLTAGHCADFDPDEEGPRLPDGVPDLTGVVEFNVPLSYSNGFPIPAAVDDQYPIDEESVVWRYDGVDQGLGKDWAVFAVFAAETGLLPHEAYGLPFRMTREKPDAGNTVRVTGFGSDDTPPGSQGYRNAQNFTDQTATGPYVDEGVSGQDIEHEYQVDTTGGNSGSPIIWTANDLTIGIHTFGGCDDGAGNHGTSFEVDALESALQNFRGANVMYVDSLHPRPVFESGTIYRPFSSVQEALYDVVSGGIISIVAGTYAGPGNVFIAGADGTSVIFEAPVGAAVIGVSTLARAGEEVPTETTSLEEME